jgi:hypothetical protein
VFLGRDAVVSHAISEVVSPEARVSNTGLTPYKASEYSCVFSGVDTLVLSVRGSVIDDVTGCLADLKSAVVASAGDSGLDAQPVVSPYVFFGEPLLLLPYGRKSWRYVLHNSLVDIQLVRGGVSGVCASVRLSAYCLARYGVDLAATEALRIAYDLCGSEAEVMVSEVHLARDVAGFDVGSFWDDFKRTLLCRSGSRRTEEHGRRTQTIYVGSRKSGTIYARLYDKVAELRASHKEWTREIWDEKGWDGEAPVWRTEVVCKRDFLRSVGINQVSDLINDGKLNGLWAYLTDEWVKHVQPSSTDSNMWRAPESSWWRVVQVEFEDGEGVSDVQREIQPSLACVDELVAQAAGCLVGVHAKLGSVGYSDTFPMLEQRFAEVCVKLGLTFDELIARKRRSYTAAS